MDMDTNTLPINTVSIVFLFLSIDLAIKRIGFIGERVGEGAIQLPLIHHVQHFK